MPRGEAASCHSLHELLFATLGIFRSEDLDGDVASAGQSPAESSDGFGLVVLYAYHSPGNPRSLHHQSNTRNNVGRICPHQSIVAHEIRLALAAVHDQYLGF